MVEETIKTIREAEKEAGELVKKADETCTEILENAAAEAKTIKENASKESATRRRKHSQVRQSAHEKTMQRSIGNVAAQIALWRKQPLRRSRTPQ